MPTIREAGFWLSTAKLERPDHRPSRFGFRLGGVVEGTANENKRRDEVPLPESVVVNVYDNSGIVSRGIVENDDSEMVP